MASSLLSDDAHSRTHDTIFRVRIPPFLPSMESTFLMTMIPFLTAIAPVASRGISIALAGMFIVGVALTIISLFIAALPRILAVVNRYWPEVEDRHGSTSHPESLVPDNDAVVAAIGYVLHCEFQKQLQNDSANSGKS